MEPEVKTKFRGPGEWRSQAAQLEEDAAEQVDTTEEPE